MGVAHRDTALAATTVYQVAAQDLRLQERDRAPVATARVAITVWLHQTAAKLPFTESALAPVVLVPAVIIACRASDID